MAWVGYVVKGFFAVVQFVKSFGAVRAIIQDDGTQQMKIDAVHAEFQKVADKLQPIVDETSTTIDDSILNGLREVLHMIAELVVTASLKKIAELEGTT